MLFIYLYNFLRASTVTVLMTLAGKGLTPGAIKGLNVSLGVLSNSGGVGLLHEHRDLSIRGTQDPCVHN